jgi:hypothetical protein
MLDAEHFGDAGFHGSALFHVIAGGWPRLWQSLEAAQRRTPRNAHRVMNSSASRMANMV